MALRYFGKSAGEISREYGLAKSTVIKWASDFSSNGSLKEKDNRNDEENALLKLQKQNKQLLMENDMAPVEYRISKMTK